MRSSILVFLTAVAAFLSVENARSQDSDWLLASPKQFPAELKTDSDEQTLKLGNGIVERRFHLKPGFCTTAIQTLPDAHNHIRAVRPEAVVSINGKSYPVGGLTEQPNHAFLKTEWLKQMKPPEDGFRFQSYQLRSTQPRMKWRKVRPHQADAAWPPPGKELQVNFEHPKLPGVIVRVYYELFDGIPCFGKWVEIENNSKSTVMLNRITTEILAVVEKNNWVEAREGVAIPRPDSLHVETDFSFGGFNAPNANRHVVHWQTDPEYKTQVNYLRKTPCLLKIEPTYGPAQKIVVGQTFKSYRTFELFHDSDDQSRKDLAVRKMYRVIAPWVTENPLMFHLRVSDFQKVREAIDQCAAVGFEMVILSFGSGFNIENRDQEYLKKWKSIREYATSKGIEIGGYSLLSSRRIGGGNDIVSPAGQKPTHGNCPALTSKWGQAYFKTLYKFFDETGFSLLEHDGSYPGDVDVTPRLPFQQGELDSRWAQWKVIAQFYAWCRSKGIYLNVPDYYYLSGSNKCGMGYREVNWSLPREHQAIHTRQNIFDGTRTKTPSMGWMFVPLSQYHGGGKAATVEPLHQHLDHYELMLASNLGAGVQACYRGPRLFDTPQTQKRVAHWVEWYKQHRAILESDIIHSSSRRADGQDLDWILHANAQLGECGMLMVYNPTDRTIKKALPLNLYYCGLKQKATFQFPDGVIKSVKLDGSGKCKLVVSLPPRSNLAIVIKK